MFAKRPVFVKYAHALGRCRKALVSWTGKQELLYNSVAFESDSLSTAPTRHCDPGRKRGVIATPTTFNIPVRVGFARRDSKSFTGKRRDRITLEVRVLCRLPPDFSRIVAQTPLIAHGIPRPCVRASFTISSLTHTISTLLHP